MGYNTHVSRFSSGEIRIHPPLTWAEIKGSKFLTHGNSIEFNLRVESVDTPGGVSERRSAVGVIPTEDAFKAYGLEDDLSEIVRIYGDSHTFTGHFKCEGEENDDLWRLSVKDGRPHRVQTEIVWPGDEA
jgi:hypothetical protein